MHLLTSGAILRKPPSRFPMAVALIPVVLLLAIGSPAHGQAKPKDAPKAEAGEEPEQEIVVTARSGRRVQDEPIHVEVIGSDEVQEGSEMAPGQVSHLLNETSGVRLQIVSPSLGSANLSIRGLPGRYTRILADGLPLYGGQVGSLAILQIPPSDLGRVEIIKGAASALYGPSALGGVINLVSRRPSEQLESELTLNATTVKGQDVVGYASGPLAGNLSFSVLGGFDRQSRSDFDRDGWADLPAFNRFVVHPRAFWKDAQGDSIFVTLGAESENRRGGSIDGHLLPDGSIFHETLDTRRLDLGTVGQFQLGGKRTLSFRASATGERDRRRFGDAPEDDSYRTWFSELSLTGEQTSHIWNIGAAIQQDRFRSHQFGALDYTYSFPSLFAQDEYVAADWLTIAASARVDFHNAYGTLFSPRLSVLFRPGRWSIRTSIGSGYFTPTPLTEETEATGLSRILPLRGVRAEHAFTTSLDLGRHFGPLELNASIFGAVIRNPVDLVESAAQADRLEFVNQYRPYRSFGAELLARYHAGAITVTGGYVFLHPTKFDPETNRRDYVPLMPRHSASFSVVWDQEWGAIGFDSEYSGRQRLDQNPYRNESKPYLHLGLLGELHVTDKLTFFVNAENLTDVRQTRFDPLLLPAQAPNGRWTVDEWAPLEGRFVNGGLRARL